MAGWIKSAILPIKMPFWLGQKQKIIWVDFNDNSQTNKPFLDFYISSEILIWEHWGKSSDQQRFL